jgi:hypothetical protein
MYSVKDPSLLERTFGPIKSRIMGRFARGTPPSGTAANIDFKGFVTVFPFLLKGMLLGKAKRSPFFQQDGRTPIVAPVVVPLDEKNALRKKLGF